MRKNSKFGRSINRPFKMRFTSVKFRVRNNKTTICCVGVQIIYEGKVMTPLKTFYGTSNCNATDTYNEVVGRHIAESRAKAAAYQWCEMEAKAISKNIMNFSNAMFEAFNDENKHLRKYEKEYCNS